MDQNARLQPVLIGVQILSLLPKIGDVFQWRECLPYKQEIESSSPPVPTRGP